MSTPSSSNTKEDATRSLLSHGMTLFEMARAYMKGTYRDIPNWSILVTLVSLGYVVSPIDAFPEIVLGPLGAIDDVFVLGLALKLINHEIQRYTTWKNTSSQGTAGNGKIVDV
jgi:uncharacterized membrane protein YkvA (DUF1232 family)